MKLRARIKDVMRRQIKTIKENASIKDAANIMKRNRIGSVVVINNKNKIVGIVTKTDIVYKHVAEGKKRLKDIMTKRLIKISSEKTLEDAARVMNENKIEKLLVYDNEKPVGIISITDILRVEPELFDILIEKLKQAMPTIKESEPLFGICENCGNYSDSLIEVNGIYICPKCVEEKE
ncbi:MAG: CBS domain-containing protein [Candidatus Aenigmatarchaeota archaeon]